MRNPKWHRDEIILALDLYFDKDRGTIDPRNPKILELSDILNRLPIFEVKPDQEKFRNPNGVSLKLANFQALDPDYAGKGMEAYSRLDKDVFDEFSNNKHQLSMIASKIKSIALDLNLSDKIFRIEDDDTSTNDSAREGQVLYKLHKVRERDGKIIDAKKKKTLKEKGKLECEACGFDFEAKYGKLGLGFIECHHIVPLHRFESSKETRLEDLALVCSNCHRMLHRNISVLDITEFKNIINK
jgi:5-methylcytosine-specific restriction protein A